MKSIERFIPKIEEKGGEVSSIIEIMYTQPRNPGRLPERIINLENSTKSKLIKEGLEKKIANKVSRGLARTLSNSKKEDLITNEVITGIVSYIKDQLKEMEKLKLPRSLILKAITRVSASEMKVMRERYPAVVVAMAIENQNPRKKAEELGSLFEELSEKGYLAAVVAMAIENQNPRKKAEELNLLFRELREKGYPYPVVARAIRDRNPRKKAEELGSLFEELSEKGYPAIVVDRAIRTKNPRKKAEEMTLEEAFKVGKEYMGVTEEVPEIENVIKEINPKIASDKELLHNLVNKFERKGFPAKWKKTWEQIKKKNLYEK